MFVCETKERQVETGDLKVQHVGMVPCRRSLNTPGHCSQITHKPHKSHEGSGVQDHQAGHVFSFTTKINDGTHLGLGFNLPGDLCSMFGVGETC